LEAEVAAIQDHRINGERIRLGRVLLKTALLFILFNFIFAALDPIAQIGRLTLYNRLYPGRPRLPYGEDPDRSHNLNVTQLEAAVYSHELWGQPGDEEEFRVLLLGDSAVWGFYLPNEETLSAEINQLQMRSADGRLVRAYNFGYPTMAVLKDLLLLERGLAANPDLVVWFVTLESLYEKNQVQAPLIRFNPTAAEELLVRVGLRVGPPGRTLPKESFSDRTIVGRRKMLAELVRHQVLGVLWTTTGVDWVSREAPARNMVGLDGLTYKELSPGELTPELLAFDVLDAAHSLAPTVPLLIINEPVYMLPAELDPGRLNPLYPRWAYARYLELIEGHAAAGGWDYADLGEALPEPYFADTTLHYNHAGAAQLAEVLAGMLAERAIPSH
jgi:hypothetical protein